MIYLIRHTSVNVPPGVCYGQSDVPVNDTFEQEAQVVKDKLEAIKSSFEKKEFDAVFCSPLSRCVKLAEYCGYKLKPIAGNITDNTLYATSDNRIKEINFGEWEMRKFDEITDPRLQEWYKDYLAVRATGGEGFEDVYLRVGEFLSGLKNTFPDSYNIALFVHGGVIGCARIFAKQFTPDQIGANMANYGDVFEIEI